MKFGIIGGGSWATALAKILTDNKHSIHWWIRNVETIKFIKAHGHNPNYLSAARFNVSLLSMSADIKEVVKNSDVLVIGVPSAFIQSSLSVLSVKDWEGKKLFLL